MYPKGDVAFDEVGMTVPNPLRSLMTSVAQRRVSGVKQPSSDSLPIFQIAHA